ncbi:MAG: hypothetical protein OWT28_01500 [Firmicutes bacterium]|nr:hypothetical protein [Bacillota bacterium]
MQSSTEQIVGDASYWMEFDFTHEMGYQEWRGMFLEAGSLSQFFNAYMVQLAEGQSMVSTTPVKLSLFDHAMYLAPPLEEREYYMEIPRTAAARGRLYFTLPKGQTGRSLEGYKPPLSTWQALDIWTVMGGVDTQTVVTLLCEANFRTDSKEYHITRWTKMMQ